MCLQGVFLWETNRAALRMVGKMRIPWSRRAAPLFLTFVFAWLYSTLLPEPRAAKLNCAGAHTGNLTPPRISPSCPHCLSLWLGRGTIIGERGRCETGCHTCFWMDGNRWAPCLAVFYADTVCTGGPGASSASLLPVLRGSSADVIQSPDMTAWARYF